MPKANDAIFDYGCGKGGPLVSFLDYGFDKVGGVEYDPKLYEVLKENMKHLGIKEEAKLICGDAANVSEELDDFNWFYFYLPFDNSIFEKCINQICKSYERKKRKMRILNITPYSNEIIENTKIFKLTNQFTIDLRQRVVNIYETV